MLSKLFKKKVTSEDLQNEKISHIELGRLGEKFGQQFLKSQGYKILETNYKSMGFEIDVIAEHAGYIVFVEIKTRRSKRYGMPSEAVTKEKQRRYKMISSLYLTYKQLLHKYVRFDVLEIIDGKPNLIINAFI